MKDRGATSGGERGWRLNVYGSVLFVVTFSRERHEASFETVESIRASVDLQTSSRNCGYRLTQRARAPNSLFICNRVLPSLVIITSNCSSFPFINHKNAYIYTRILNTNELYLPHKWENRVFIHEINVCIWMNILENCRVMKDTRIKVLLKNNERKILLCYMLHTTSTIIRFFVLSCFMTNLKCAARVVKVILSIFVSWRRKRRK